MSDIREVKARLRQAEAHFPDIAALLADHDRLERERGVGKAYTDDDVHRALQILAEYPPEDVQTAHCILDLLADLRERCAESAREQADFYSTDVFKVPPSGEHGDTIDACSARAIRAIVPGIAYRIRALPLLPEKPR